MARLINAQEKQIRELKGEKGRLELVVLDMKQKRMDKEFSKTRVGEKERSQEMLDELNHLLEQNRGLVREVD